MPDGFVFDEQAMDYVPVDDEARRLRLRVKELEHELDLCRRSEMAQADNAAALACQLGERDAWSRLWKRYGKMHRDNRYFMWWHRQYIDAMLQGGKGGYTLVRDEVVPELRRRLERAQQWARLWKRAATVNRMDREEDWWYSLRHGDTHFVNRQDMTRPYVRTLRRALGLPDATTPDEE